MTAPITTDRRFGPTPGDPIVRFWAKVDKRGPDECWLWIPPPSDHGYGIFCPTRVRRIRAHRYAYELLVGPIPEGLILDHLCRVRHCVNPAHLEPVTQATNKLRGFSIPAVNARKTHCKYGHELTPENTYVPPRRLRHRQCVICRKRLGRESRLRREVAP